MNNYLLYYKKDNTIKLVNVDKVIDDLYELHATVPTIKQINEYIKNGSNTEIKKYLKSDDPAIIISQIKKSISKINNKIPLYDTYKKNLFIVSKRNIYDRVVHQSYRFPDRQLIEILTERKLELEPIVKELKNNGKKTLKEYAKTEKGDIKIVHEELSKQTEYHKLELMLEFLNSFDIDILETTYIKAFYFYSNEVGKNITVCTRPSFLPHYVHIKPYYTRSELINLALNMGIIEPSNKIYEQKEIMKLCDKVRKNDIRADTILKHQEHIIKENKIGVVQYYSMQGSFFMNKYLRNLTNYEYKNELLEKAIESTWKLILGAPEFDKNYTLYRFIHNDDYLKHLKIGDVYIDPSFISTTRDPFYRSETYKFGFILIKINIPKNVKGVGLCLESYSYFPDEQEIILPPLSKLRLDKKDDNAQYFHTDEIFASKVSTRYEFTFIGSNKINFIDRPEVPNKEKLIDFLQIQVYNTVTIYEKIQRFIDDQVNEIGQFRTKIGNIELDLMIEWYDSTNAYKNFYAATTNNGFSIYTIHNDYVLFMIEIGENNSRPYMFVNYFFKYAAVHKNIEFKDAEFIEFLAKIAYYFGVENVVLYTEYASCDIDVFGEKIVTTYHGGNYCIDFYKYLKHKERRFKNKNINIDSTQLKNYFSYYELERLRTTHPLTILIKDDRDEIYQIYNKVYKLYSTEEKDNLADFYIWMVENYCVFLGIFIKKMDRLFINNNPFLYDFYVLDAGRYLYDNNLISELLVTDKKTSDKDIFLGNKVPKNEYRLQFYKRDRVPEL